MNWNYKEDSSLFWEGIERDNIEIWTDIDRQLYIAAYDGKYILVGSGGKNDPWQEFDTFAEADAIYHLSL